MYVEPVVGELQTADLVPDQPLSARSLSSPFDMCRLLQSSRAVGVAADVVGAADERLAAGVPSVVGGAVVVLSVVVVEGLGDGYQCCRGLSFGSVAAIGRR